MPISVYEQDIFTVTCDAIVNPANVSLLAGGGLCGIIHKKAGKQLKLACQQIGPQQVGAAVCTDSFNIENCSYVIHACGPRWLDGNHGEVQDLEACYRNIFELALKRGIRSLAVPAISTGIYRFPYKQATDIAVAVARQYEHVLDIYFVNTEVDKHCYYQQALEKKHGN